MSRMNRRGFLSSLRGVFSKQRDGDPVFFGFQAVINVYGEDELRQRIHRIIAEAPEQERPQDKRAYYKRLSALLREHVASIEYGFWDHVTDRETAEGEFDEWVLEIEASAATVEEELGTNHDEEFRLSSEKDYIVVSLLFLIEHGREHVPLATMLNEIPEGEEYTPQAFQTLIEAVNYIEFERCLADASFILPGSDQDGFSWTDMRAPGWEYLRPIMGSLAL